MNARNSSGRCASTRNTFGINPDFSCTAKAITNAYFPFGAVMIAEHVAETFEKDESGKAAAWAVRVLTDELRRNPASIKEVDEDDHRR